MTDREVRELKKRVANLEDQLNKQGQLIKQIIDEIEDMEERGLARFDAGTWTNPSDVHTAWRVLNEQAEKSPDGYVMKENIKVKVAHKEDIAKTKARKQVRTLVDDGVAVEHEHQSEKIKPRSDISDEDIRDLMVSNFELADARREKAESRGKDRDPR